MLDIESIKKVSDIYRESLYSSICIPDASQLEATLLRKSEIPGINVFARTLEESSRLRRDNSRYFMDVTREIADLVYEILLYCFPHLFFEITSRRKSYVSEHHKRFSRFLKGQSPFIRDMIAIRIKILNDPSDEEEYHKLLSDCDKVINTLIDYLCRYSLDEKFKLSFDLLLREAEPPSNSKPFEPSTHPEIIVPRKSDILSAYEFGIKNYNFYPKENGYQSIHTVMEISPYSPKCGGMDFELQLRTIRMHRHSENGIANHDDYKDAKLSVEADDPDFDWKQHFEFDLNKIKFIGFSFDSKGNIYDSAGFMRPIALYSRFHTIPF